MRVFLCSPWIPPEWVRAFGHEPRGVWFSDSLSEQLPPESAGGCEFAHSVVDLCLREPESAFVFATHCDQLRRSFDRFSTSARVFLFNLPSSAQSPSSARLYASELERLGHFLTRIGGRWPAEEAIARTFDQAGHSRAQLASAAGSLPASDLMEALVQQLEKGEVNPLPSPLCATTSSDAVPLALIGGSLPRHRWPLLRHIEKLGGRIVLQAAEPGERNLWVSPGAAAVTRTPPPAGLAAWAVRVAEMWNEQVVDVYRRPNDALYTWLKERLRAREVRGILLWHYTWCDLWRAEAQTLRETFGLPLLQLEADASAGPISRIMGRIEAFLESLR